MEYTPKQHQPHDQTVAAQTGHEGDRACGAVFFGEAACECREANVVSDFSRQNRPTQKTRTLRNEPAPLKLQASTQSHAAPTKVADYIAVAQCREALEPKVAPLIFPDEQAQCGGLTPHCACSSGKTSELQAMSQAKQPCAATFRSSKLTPPKVKAGSSPRTPKASATLGNGSQWRASIVVSDFSRQNLQTEETGLLRRESGLLKPEASTQSHVARTKVADYGDNIGEHGAQAMPFCTETDRFDTETRGSCAPSANAFAGIPNSEPQIDNLDTRNAILCAQTRNRRIKNVSSGIQTMNLEARSPSLSARTAILDVKTLSLATFIHVSGAKCANLATASLGEPLHSECAAPCSDVAFSLRLNATALQGRQTPRHTFPN